MFEPSGCSSGLRHRLSSCSTSWVELFAHVNLPGIRDQPLVFCVVSGRSTTEHQGSPEPFLNGAFFGLLHHELVLGVGPFGKHHAIMTGCFPAPESRRYWEYLKEGPLGASGVLQGSWWNRGQKRPCVDE